MPCIKLSSGKTVCYGDEPTTYSQGGTIFFNHQPVRFDPGGGVNIAPNMQPAMEQFRKQQAQVAKNNANPFQSSGLKPDATTKPTNVLKVKPTSTVKMPPVNTRMARTDATQVARPNAQLFQAKLDQKENDPLGYAAAAKLAESRRGQGFGERLLDDSLQWMGENPELTAIAAPLAIMGAAEVIPGIAAETALLEAPAALTEAFETANSLYKGYQTINKGIDAGKNVASGNYAGAAGNVLDIGKSFIPAANLNVAKDLAIDTGVGALQGYGETGTLEGTARGAFDNTVVDRLAGKATGNKDTFGRNIVKDQLKSAEASFKDGGKTDDDKINKDAIAFHKGWLESPMYKQMLEASVDKDDPVGFDFMYRDFITQRRKEGIDNTEARILPFTEKLRQQVWPEKDADAWNNRLQGFAFQQPDHVKGYYNPYMSFFNLNPKGTAYNNRYYTNVPTKGFNQIYTKNDTDKLELMDTQVHEFSHASDYGGSFIPPSDIKLMKSLSTRKNPKAFYEDADDDYKKYVAEPTETRARLQAMRELAQNKKIYDPYTQKATMKSLEDLKKLDRNAYHELRTIYTDQDILKLLNTISMNESTTNSSNPSEFAKEGSKNTKTTTMDINKLKSQLAAMQDEINRTAEQYGLGGHLQKMLHGGEVHQLPVMPYGFAEDGSYMTNTKVYSPEELRTMKLNQATSIVDAMKLMGDDSSFANRKMMAERMGIKNYTGTPAQNEELMQKYYASKRQFSEDQDMMNSSGMSTPGLPSQTPTLSPSGERPAPQLPSSPQNVVQDQGMTGGMYEFDEMPPNSGAMMMGDTSGGTAMPPDTRVRTLADLPPRETMAPVDLSQRLEKTAIAEMPETRRPAPVNVVPQVPVNTPKKSAPAPVVKKPTVSKTQKPILETTKFNSLSNFDKTTQNIITEIAARNNGKVFLTDKGTKSTIVGTVKNGKVDLQAFPVLTGQQDKPGMYPDGYSLEDVNENKNLRYTPTGAFALDEYQNIYGKPGLFLRGLDDAYHVTYPGEYAERTPKYTDANISNNNMSYGCINGRCGDMATLTEMFNTGDSSYVVDTRLPYNQNIKMINTNQHKKLTKEDGGMNYYSGGEIENDPHIMELYGFQNGGEVIQLPVMPYGFAEMGMMTGDDVTGKPGRPGRTPAPAPAPTPTTVPSTPKVLTSQQLAGLTTQFFSRDPSMQTPIPNFLGNYQLSNVEKTIMMEAMRQMKAGQGSTGVYPVITPQMIDQIRPRVEQNDYFNERRTQSMGGMNYEDGGQMPMDIAVARFKAAAKDKGLAGGEAMAYVEKMKSKYNYQKGGAVSEKELGNYEVGMYGSGGIMYNGTKFPGYNKAISTAPGDKFKKQMVLEKGGKIKLVKFGHR
jgi:hypothetical protein